MDEYKDFPQLSKLKKVLQSYPHTALLYITLYKQKPKLSRISVRKNNIKKVYLSTPTLFRNAMLALSKLDLVIMREDPEHFYIDLL